MSIPPHPEGGDPDGRSWGRGGPRLRSIRWQIVAAIAGVSLAVGAVLMPFSWHRIEASFHGFELSYARHEGRRFEILMAEQANSLKRTALDYSRWDDAADFIAAPNPAWMEANLAEDVLENFGAESVRVADRNLRVVGMRATAHARSLPNAERGSLDAPLCRAAMASRTPLHRFVTVHGTVHLRVCSPVYRPRSPGRIVGAMLWTVELTRQRLATVSKLVRFEFALRPAGTAPSNKVFVTDNSLHLTAPLRDHDGRVSVQADLLMPRPLGPQRDLASTLILVLVGIALVVPPLLVLLVLEVRVVRRIRGMSEWVRSLRRAEPAKLARHLASMTSTKAGSSELQMLGDDVAGLAMHLESMRASWQQQALHDALTGLPNRTCLIQDIETHFHESVEPIGLLVVDLDGFKAVNDMLGHHTGDALLVDAARRLQTLLPSHARAYRLGGDEFAVAAMPSTKSDVEAIADRVAADMRFVRHADGRPLVVSASTGVALSGEDQVARTASSLLTVADAAMYEAKRTGRGAWRRISPDTRSRQREQIEVSIALRAALVAGRIEAWFQPIIAARSRQLVAVEALARWNEPGWGPIPPQRFIPVAERSGQILDLDLAVLAFSLGPFTRLLALDAGLRLHANVSAQSLSDAAYVGRFGALLAAHGLHAGSIVLELTETDLAIEHVQLEAALGRLRRMGAGLSVDDFGVGSSSLARLSVLKPDCVKIDGSFVRDMDGDGGAICRVVIELARELGLDCIAEYVETEAQADALMRMGCHALQGDAPGKPAPAAEFVARYGESLTRRETVDAPSTESPAARATLG